MTATPTLASAVTGMGAATAVSRALGAVRVLVIAAVLGTTYLGNTFQSSNLVSNVFFELLAAGALSAVLVPTFVGLLDGDRQADAERLAGAVLGLALTVLGAISLLGVLAAPWLARVLTTAVEDPAVAEDQRRLATFLLRFFIPQIALYGLGTVATAILHARRRFMAPALAPIGNTVAVVGALVVFRMLAGADPGLDLTLAERIVLGVGGTLGVAAFVGVPLVALAAGGFRLRPRLAWRDVALQRLLRLSGWATLQHAGIGLLLGGAIVVGGAVEGGVVAFQVATVTFLAPYGILAQPVHTAVLPELSAAAAGGDDRAFGAGVRWALHAMAVPVVPVSAGLVALAQPVMAVFAFGEATTADGVGLMAAGLAALAVGLFAYGAFLLLARAYYALGDSRTPAVVALVTAVGGVAIMVGAAGFAEDRALVAAIGAGHSAAYAVAAVVLAIGLRRRTGQPLLPPGLLPVTVLSVVLAVAAKVAVDAWDPRGRLATAVALVLVGAAGAAAYVVVLRRLHGLPPGSPPVVEP